MPRRPILLALLIALAVAPAAHADDYPATTAAELTSAFSDAGAHPGPDRVLVAAGTFTGNFDYTSADPVEIIGAGTSQTTLTAAGGTVLTLSGGAHRVSDMRIELSGGVTGYGLSLGGTATAERLLVRGAWAATDATGVVLDGDVTLRDATVIDFESRGVWAVGGAHEPVVDNVAVSGIGTGIEAEGNGMNAIVRRARVDAGYAAVAATFGAKVTLTDSRVGVPAGAIGLRVGDNNNGGAFTTFLDARRVTVVGAPFATGLRVDAGSPGDDMRITLRDSIVSGFQTSLHCSASGGGAAAIDLHYSDVLGARAGSCAGAITEDHVMAVNPRFANEVGDYSLAADSPLLDAGDPAADVPAGTLDLAGNHRLLDGDGDCVRRVDLGAYERRRDAPVARAAAGAATTTAGHEVAFSAAGSCPSEPGGTLTYTWAFDDGGQATGADVAHAFATAGDHVATLTVSDGAGSATATATVHVDAGPGDGGAGPPPGGGGQVKPVAPKLSGLKVDPRRHVVWFRLDRAARVRVVVSRRVHGRWRTVASRTVTARGGRTRVRLGRKLRGRVRVALTATTAEGGRAPAVRRFVRLR